MITWTGRPGFKTSADHGNQHKIHSFNTSFTLKALLGPPEILGDLMPCETRVVPSVARVCPSLWPILWPWASAGFLSSLDDPTEANTRLLRPCAGSDITVQITTRDARLLVRLPFGSQTQTFLKEVRKRCCPGKAPLERRSRPRGLEGSLGSRRAAGPAPTRPWPEGKIDAHSVLLVEGAETTLRQIQGMGE